MKLMHRFNISITRENYLDLAYMGEVPPELISTTLDWVVHNGRSERCLWLLALSAISALAINAQVDGR